MVSVTHHCSVCRIIQDTAYKGSFPYNIQIPENPLVFHKGKKRIIKIYA